jgi:hypothetical protein
MNLHHERLSVSDDYSGKQHLNIDSANTDLRLCKKNVEEENTSANDDGKLRKGNIENSSRTAEDANFYTTVIQIVWFAVLCGLIAITLFWFPTQISFGKSHRQSRYADATTTLKSLRDDRDQFESMSTNQISAIKQLQNHATMYVNVPFQKNANDLVESLQIAMRSPSRELSKAYSVSAKIPFALEQAYKRIEVKTIKTNRRKQAENLLIGLNEILQT